ncbi:GH25 family lysozyme M1 (1,4-beta-N-acetylmuramidase) [Clostridiales Family XIII bacterium PM5-7]
MILRKSFFTLVITLTALIIVGSSAYAADAKVDNNTYSHHSKFDNTIVIDGVDTSYWQGNVDWTKVKKAGIDFVYMRIGYTGLDSPFNMNPDSYFESNFSAAKAAGVQVGIYYYAQSISTAEAEKEANYVLKLLNGREIDLPIIFDYEFGGGRLNTAYNKWSSSTRKAKMSANALMFLSTIKKAGYEPMFYSYYNMMNNSFDMPLIDGGYKVWLAHYNTSTGYSRPYDVWQYTSSGSVNGISGRADCNFWYLDPASFTTKTGTTSIADSTVTLGTNTYTYNGSIKKPSVKVTLNGQTLTVGTDYEVRYIKNVLSGTAYAMIYGKGSYSNVALKAFTIKPQTLSASNVSINDIADVTYSGSAKKPTVTIKRGTATVSSSNYTLTYTNNTNAGTATVTATGVRNYTGSVSKTFTIKKATPTITTSASTYNKTSASADFSLGAKTTSNGKLTYKSSNTAIATVSAEGKVSLTGKTGTATITITSPSTTNYVAKSKTVTVNVDQSKLAPTITTTTSIKKEVDDPAFHIEYTTNSDGAVSFKSSDTTIATVSSTGLVTILKQGTVKFTISTAETNTYKAGTKTITCTIGSTVTGSDELIAGVQGTDIDITSTVGTNYIKLTWEKEKGYLVDGYQLYRSTKKTTGFKSIFNSTKTTCKNMKNISKGTRYYYKVRGYRTIDGTKIYTKWSKTVYRTAKFTSNDVIIKGVEDTGMTISSSVGTGYIKLTWEREKGFLVDGYKLYRSTKKTSGFTSIYSTKKLTCKNTKNLTKGTRYYYKVRGYRTVAGETIYTKWSGVVNRIAK